MSMSKVLVTVFGLLLTLSSINASTIAYWRFEPGNLTLDSSGNGHTLVNAGAASSGDVSGGAPGTGSALFDGTDIMNTLATLDLSSYTQLTIEWFMKPNLAASSTLAAVWEQSANLFGGTGPGAVASFINNQAPAVNILEVDARLFATTKAYAVVPGGVSGGVWHHYVMEVDKNNIASNYKLFIDGVATGTLIDGSTGNSFINDTLYIGARSGVGFPFTGNLDEFRISSGLLSPFEFIPEPSSAALLGLGGILLFRRRS